MGRIAGVYGLHGWVKVISHTRERAGILGYRQWMVRLAEGWREFRLAGGRIQGTAVVAQLEGITDRDAAAALVGADIAVPRSQLPPLGHGTYYWTQLEGLGVVNAEGVELGRVSSLFETGANDVMVVTGDRERLIPFVRGVVLEVDLAGGTIRVDWDPGF